ncbi:unnamed protein product [Prorocentrum cordatum]|uniref:Sulfotransferase family protein n=1 Tax=Prorocentrum cordatum TaxID=2364126 RepID=A0ABN9T4T1_9DINO|nr:unnamed protein product [Polarella glacialis]
MSAVCRAASLLQVIGAVVALSGPRAAPGPGEPLYGWVAGDEFGAGGPSQMAGAHALASKRSVPSTRATRSDLAGKAQRLDRWPFHLKARILLPRAKLAFCYMPKVASNQIATLFGELNRVHGEKWPWEPWEYSGPAKLNIDWSRVTRENGWKFAFLHRDPLARYLSAFGSKCMVNAKYGNVEGAGKDCLGKVQWTALPMDKMVEAFEERVRFDALVGRPVNNSHWFPMIKNLRACGIDKFHPDIVDFKGSIDEDRAHPDLIDWMQCRFWPARSGSISDIPTVRCGPMLAGILVRILAQPIRFDFDSVPRQADPTHVPLWPDFRPDAH